MDALLLVIILLVLLWGGGFALGVGGGLIHILIVIALIVGRLPAAHGTESHAVM